MIKSEIILWRILAITGLNFLNYRLGPTAKCFRALFMVSFPVLLLYFLATALCNVRKQNYKKSIAAFLLPVYSGLLWCFAYSRKRAISNVVLEVYRFRKHDNVSNKTMHCIIVYLTIIMPTLYSVSFIFNQIMTDFDTFDLELHTFGFKVQNKIFKRFLSFYLHIADFFFCSGFIFYLTICICVLFHRCSEILSNYKKFLQICLQKGIANYNKDYFSEYFYIVKFLRKMSGSFSHLTFLIIVYYLKAIFIILLSLSMGQMHNADPYTIIIFLYHSIRGILAIVSFTICSSLIPEHLTEIRAVVGNFLNSCGCDRSISKENLFYL